MNRALGVSFVIPVHNGAAYLHETLASVVLQADGGPMEIIVIDDASEDQSGAVLRQLATVWPLRIIQGEGRGAAAALNAGIDAATFPFICQVDQDVVLHPGWLRQLLLELEDASVAAAQGYFVSDPDASMLARVMGLDLEDRYANMIGHETDHVCTGNAIYRVDALRAVGLFDETLGYGCDNDMSYRLRAGGYRLAFCRTARSTHRWREGLTGYLAQQYGFGYGRLDVVAKHPRRCVGDAVSPAGMMAHPLLLSIGLFALASSTLAGASGAAWAILCAVALVSVGALMLERVVAAVRARVRFGDNAVLWFPIVHLLRDLAWVGALLAWSLRRILRREPEPRHSMHGRAASSSGAFASACAHDTPAPLRILAIIPAHNEVANLPCVIADLRRHRPDVEVLVVDDGSSDGTSTLLEQLGVRWLRWTERQGVGAAVRAGLKYAARSGFHVTVRMDADGQHGVEDIERMVQPIRDGMAEVVLGSRYATSEQPRQGLVGVVQRVLGACLSVLTRGRVTDATSGFCALGPRAILLLAEHHPGGYPEPELRLFLSRNALRVVEVPVRARVRLSGRTSLTPGRLVTAGARVLLAMLIVPLRSVVGRSA